MAESVETEPFELGALARGATLGGYVIERPIGKGGMAVVYEARHQGLGKRVAIKTLLPSHAAQADVARRFLREGENAARLDHPHVVDVTDVGTGPNGVPYLVMEYLDGEDLAGYLERVVRLSVEATADILVPVISAVSAAHDLGIIHRDLKPHNLFLCAPRKGPGVLPKVLDFGISKLLEGESLSLTGTDALLGTPFYMSPEQARGARRVDARTDQFSLGVIAYECITGKRPFVGDSLYSLLAAIVHGTPEPPSRLTHPLDPAFEAIVNRTLSKDPEQRFPHLRDFGCALIHFASPRVQLQFAAEFGLAPGTRVSGALPQASPPMATRALTSGAGRLALRGAALVCFAAAIGGALLIRRGERVAPPLLAPAAPRSSSALDRPVPAPPLLAEPERTEVAPAAGSSAHGPGEALPAPAKVDGEPRAIPPRPARRTSEPAARSSRAKASADPVAASPRSEVTNAAPAPAVATPAGPSAPAGADARPIERGANRALILR